MQPQERRLFRALARQGLVVTRDGPVTRVQLAADPLAPPAEILLPSTLPLEAKAAVQLAQLAAVHHPDGGRPCRVCATPDFHPGDSGIAIGSVVETEDLLIPQAVGTDINCGMRLHTLDLGVERFLTHKAELVRRLTGDYLLGTRDIVLRADAMEAMFRSGLPDWLQAVRKAPLGTLARADLSRIEAELPQVFASGSLPGDLQWVPPELMGHEGEVREDGLGTIGRGNHFVEIGVIESLVDRKTAWQWGLKVGQLTMLVHSGSRKVGKVVGTRWKDRAKEAWPRGLRHPRSDIWPLSWTSTPELCEQYLQAEATAANYAFVNRALLAELLRVRLEEVLGEVSAPLVADIPHNLTFQENGRYVARKGACPAHEGQPVIIPGSMGAPSYIAVGKGHPRFLSSASHGAGRAKSRQEVRGSHQELGLEGVDCVTLREERRIEEAPAAYKDIHHVIDAQVEAGTVGVVAVLRPLLTFKA
jgi:tRNA-splicing ligase RtcB